jgi:hypothetical protein
VPLSNEQDVQPEQEDVVTESAKEMSSESAEVTNNNEQVLESNYNKNVDQVERVHSDITTEQDKDKVGVAQDIQSNESGQKTEEQKNNGNENVSEVIQEVKTENVTEEKESRVEDDIEIAKKVETKRLLENSSESMRRVVNVLRYREDYRLADLFERPDFLLVEAQNLEDVEHSNEIDLGKVNSSLKRLAQGFYEMVPHGPNASHDDLDNLHDMNSSMNDLGHSVYDLIKSIKENYHDSNPDKEAEFNDLVKNGEVALASLEDAILKIQRRRDYGEFIQV